MGKHALTIPLPENVWQMLTTSPPHGDTPLFEDLFMQEGVRLLLRMPTLRNLSDDQFYEFCQNNRNLRIEQNQEGDVVIMAPTGGVTSWRNSKIVAMLVQWEETSQEGAVFDSSGGFILPNGAKRSPDASWVKRSRLSTLTTEQKQKFLPLCPDFVIELRSPSDTLEELQTKMEEYLGNGARLGWLIEPDSRCVYVYRPEQEVERLENPHSVSGELVLPGFRLNLDTIWTPDF